MSHIYMCYVSNYLLGVVRKLLGLSFLGETREEEVLIVGDVVIPNIDSDVRFYYVHQVIR